MPSKKNKHYCKVQKCSDLIRAIWGISYWCLGIGIFCDLYFVLNGVSAVQKNVSAIYATPQV